MRRPLLASTTALAAALAGFPAAAQTEAESVYRLFVADHAEPVVRAIDLETGTVVATFETEGAPAVLRLGSDAETVYAIQGDANVVQVIAGGIGFDDHGDHADVEVGEPSLLPVTLEGERPVHFVPHHGDLAVFFDGEGVVRIYDEARLVSGEPGEPRVITTAAPHHGLGASLGAHVIVSIPNPEDPSESPVGIRVLDGSGAQVGGDHACPGLHGEASSGAFLAIGCATGILLVEEGGTEPAVRLLPYPADFPADEKTGTLLGGTAMQYFLGNYGSEAVVLVDPAEDAFTLVPLPYRRVHFALDPARPDAAYVLTEDGTLHRLNTLTGEFEHAVPVTAAYSMDGHWNDPRPRIAVAGDAILVTDPGEGLVRVLDAETLEERHTIAVEGMPFNIAVVGGSGATH